MSWRAIPNDLAEGLVVARCASKRCIAQPRLAEARPTKSASAPNPTAGEVGVALDGVLAEDDVLLCVDGDTAVIAYAKKHGIEFETIIASKGEHVHETSTPPSAG
jgi:hypothetical protein